MRITLAEPRRFNELLRQRYELPSRSVVRGVTIDSRTVRPGDLFIAIVGSRVDGHEKVAEAVAAGAVAVMVENDVSIPGGAASIRTNDNVKEFGRLAAEWHGMFRIPVVGITGSNGKTTTKDLLAAILRRKYHVLASERSMNSTTGLPLTLLRQEEAHEVAVIELGANKPGEIAYLTRLARPSLGLITNVSLTHVEYFHDLAGVVQEKTKLFRGLPPEGIAYINADVPELVEQDVPCRRY
ncbi:MAG: UDP-N-acetylmuramoyl-tripeptide--D-alanyl-D-alanine ligase, partial [Candidatus Marinimicrobia bacterium]|nr:UDP-N-acetylmuramoyl-tripeptide--D-alanyl-D-alanine ligase [Candidatus Neomarinimicrobiota bacterium]